AAAAARNQGHAGIAIADRDRRHFTRGVARHGHAEYGAIEHPERRVMVGGDGQMIELAEHPRLLAARLRRIVPPIEPQNAAGAIAWRGVRSLQARGFLWLPDLPPCPTRRHDDGIPAVRTRMTTRFAIALATIVVTAAAPASAQDGDFVGKTVTIY